MTLPTMVNAWIFLNEDQPPNSNYNSSDSSYQRLINNNVYRSVDRLFISFATTLPTSATTIPPGDGSSYTIAMGNFNHPNRLSNQDYMNFIIRDAKHNNPNIQFSITLNWGDGALLANIFQSGKPPAECAAKFASNLKGFLFHYGLSGFDIDWEAPISNGTSVEQFRYLINAIGQVFRQDSRDYTLTLSPAEVGNLDANAVNNNVDFINLQLYSGFTDPREFESAGVNKQLFAYGAEFESHKQTAKTAFDENELRYGYSIFTCWRLNSSNYVFEQDQQQALYALVFPQEIAEQCQSKWYWEWMPGWLFRWLSRLTTA